MGVGLCRYDPLALLAAHPTTLERFFEVELKTVQGVEHMVVGTSEESPGIRNGNALRSFMMDAFAYALSETREHALTHVAAAEKCNTPSTPRRSSFMNFRSSMAERSSPVERSTTTERSSSAETNGPARSRGVSVSLASSRSGGTPKLWNRTSLQDATRERGELSPAIGSSSRHKRGSKQGMAPAETAEGKVTAGGGVIGFKAFSPKASRMPSRLSTSR